MYDIGTIFELKNKLKIKIIGIFNSGKGKEYFLMEEGSKPSGEWVKEGDVLSYVVRKELKALGFKEISLTGKEEKELLETLKDRLGLTTIEEK